MNPKRAMLITTLVCLTTIVSHSFGRSAYGLLVPAIEDDLGLTHSQAGVPSSGIYLIYIVGVLWVVFTSAWVEPVSIMRVALGLSVVGLALAATANSLGALTIGVSLAGGAGAGIWMTAPVLVTEYVSEKRRGVVIGALTSSIGVSNVALGFGTSALRRRADDPLLWRPIWWIALVVTAVLFVAMVGIARFKKTERISGSARTIDFSILRSIPAWKTVTLAYALFGGLSAGFSAFIVAALEDHGGWSRTASTSVFSLVGIAGMIAAPSAGALSDKLGRPVVMRLVLGLLVLANLGVASGGRWLVAAGAIAYGAGASSFPSLIATYVRDSLDSRSFSQALAMMTILFSMLSVITPTVVGQIADATETFALPYLLLALLPLAGLALLMLIRTPPSPADSNHAVGPELDDFAGIKPELREDLV